MIGQLNELCACFCKEWLSIFAFLKRKVAVQCQRCIQSLGLARVTLNNVSEVII